MSKSKYCKAMAVNFQTGGRSGSGQSKRAAGPISRAERYALMMEDPGAMDNFITHTFAQGMNLPSKPLSLKLEVLRGRQIIQNKREYSLNLRNMYGARHNMKAVGLERIKEVEHALRVKLLRSIFPEAKEDVAEVFSRPHGKVDMVLGMKSRSLHCREKYDAGNLRLNRSVFAPG